MSPVLFDPDAILKILRDRGVRFVVIGGYAAALLGSPVITQDLDICYARDDENLERLADALRQLDAKLRGVGEDVPFQLDAPTLKSGDSFTFETTLGSFDVLGIPSGTRGFPDLDAGAMDMDLGNGLVVRVVALEDLMRMKRASSRPKDLRWLEELGALRDEIEGRG